MMATSVVGEKTEKGEGNFQSEITDKLLRGKKILPPKKNDICGNRGVLWCGDRSLLRHNWRRKGENLSGKLQGRLMLLERREKVVAETTFRPGRLGRGAEGAPKGGTAHI